VVRKELLVRPDGWNVTVPDRKTRGNIVRLENKLAGQSDRALSNKLDGKWSIKENIGHLAEVDEIALERIREMIQGIGTMSPAVFEPKQDYNIQPVSDVLNLFKKNRTANLHAYKTLTDTELLRSSMHPRLKLRMNPVDLAFFDAEHDDHHLVRINEIHAALIVRS
jgi:hypothetical protein